MSNFLTNFESKEPDNSPEPKRPESSESEVTKGVPASRSQRSGEEVEIDPTYKHKKRKTILKLTCLSVVLLGAIAYGAYQMSHVKMPDFSNRKIEEVRSWASDNRLTIETTGGYDDKIEVNHVMKQPVKKQKKVKKGQTLRFEVSQGADPEAEIKLPDFSKMKQAEAEKWLAENKLDKLKLITENDEKVPAGTYLKIDLKGKTASDVFKRKDNGQLFYSKGKEVLKKDILVPDFSGKPKAEIATWAKTNEVSVTFKDVANSEIESDLAFAQSVPAKEKIAKQSKITVSLSAGKAIIVPDFNQLTAEEAVSQKGVEVTVKHEYNLEVPYGKLVWQTIAAETELTAKDDLGITVTYSAGQPYLKDVVGETEGDLQKIFYDEYTSKGANIGYLVNYVSSEEKPGTVVSMSSYNIYVPLDYTVTINVSKGK